nr:Zinc finger, C2H2 domain containing protein [Ipomoea batatas]
MALLTFLPPEKQQQQQQNTQKKQQRKRKQQLQNPKKQPNKPAKPPSSWDSFKSMLTCKQVEGSAVHDPSKNGAGAGYVLGGPCGSICSFRDVVHGNTSRVVHRADNSPESSSLGQETRLLSKKNGGCANSGSSSRSLAAARSHGGSSYGGSSSRAMQFRKLSGCYECHTIVDPSRYPMPRTICACPDCGEVFPKIESLEHHQAVRHAVSELGPEDSSRNIVEIIFKSSWLKKDNPVCKIERILKVHNTQRTIQRFEDCRDAVKVRANAAGKKNPRCAADGNELLRFYCTTLTCALGARGASSLCGSLPGCGVCTIIRHGFQGNKVAGIRTTASSGRAHDCPNGGNDGRRAMLVCRVIAGRVRRVVEDTGAGDEEAAAPAGLSAGAGSYESVAGYGGIYSNLEELYVFNPRAILPCFVVIYKAMES